METEEAVIGWPHGTAGKVLFAEINYPQLK